MKQAMVLALAAGLAVSAALPASAFAQGNRNRERQRVEQRGRDNGPAFCRSGAGHPVFGREWCRDKGYRLGNERRGRDDRSDRNDDRYGRDDDRDGRADDRYGRDDDRDGRDGRDGQYPGRIGADDRDGNRNLRWRRADLGDVRFRFSGSLRGRDMNRSGLESLLGNRVVAQLTRHAYESGADGTLHGVWTETQPLVLRVYAGRVPVAEFIDRNLDRQVDTTNLAYWN